MSNSFLPGTPAIDVRIDNKSPAEFASEVYDRVGRFVTETPEQFAERLADYYVAKTNAADERADEIRRQMADAIAPDTDTDNGGESA